MTNIFNLFLYLVTIWCAFLYFASDFSTFNIILGASLSLFISFFCYYLKIINKKSELLYLSFGLYRYFFIKYISQIIPAIILQIKILFNPNFIDLQTLKIVVSDLSDKRNIYLFETTINLLAGYNIDKINDNEITITAINEEYASNFLANKIFKDLKNINDDSLV